MSTRYGLGWEVFQAVNSSPDYPYPAGGRLFSLAGIPWLFCQQYYDTFPAYRTRVANFAVDIAKWLRGGRSFGTIAVSTINVNYWWFGWMYPATQPVCTAIKDAWTSAGFTVWEYNGHVSEAVAAGVDIIEGSGLYSGEAEIDATLWNYMEAGGSGLAVDMFCGTNYQGYAGNGYLGTWTYKSGVAYYYPNGVWLSSWAGAEALFDRLNPAYGDGIPQNSSGAAAGFGGNSNIGQAHYSYPDGRWLEWHKPTEGAYGEISAFSAVTKHGDAGVGNNWASGV